MTAAVTLALADSNVSLVEYYRSRLERVETDFDECLDKVDSLKVAHRDHQALAWQVHRREAEVAELQTALSDAQTQLFDERKLLLKCVAENDALKIQELKDRKKIRYLLSMTGNQEPEITYFRDRLNKRLVKIGSETSIHEVQISLNYSKHSQRYKTNKPIQPIQRNGDRLPNSSDRDILILEDEIEGLKLQVSSLHTQLDEQSKSYEETIAGLQRDRKTLLEEESIRRAHEAKKMEELLEKSDNLRQLNRENVRELLYLKKTMHQNERRLVEEKTRLTNEILSLKSTVTKEKEKVEHIEQQVEVKLAKKHADIAADLRGQLHKCTEELVAVRRRNEELERTSQKKTDVLTSRVQMITKNYNALRRRRDYEIEGFTNDILMLRKQLKTLEKSILRFAPLEDRELVLLNMARETAIRAAKISTDLSGLKNKILNTERDLRSLVI